MDSLTRATLMDPTFSATGELLVTAQDVAGEHTSAIRAVGPPTVHAEFTHGARVGQVAPAGSGVQPAR